MANAKGSAKSLEDMLKENREKQKAQKLAEQIFGRRTKTPAGPKPKAGPGASLASRVGVAKRPGSLPRTNSAPPRQPRNSAPQHFNRPPPNENPRPRQSFPQPSSDSLPAAKSNGFTAYDAAPADGSSINIRGAAAHPNTVVASNFAPGTSAADIESVMLDVGGAMTECRLLASNPTVIAEMTFVDKSGAETVINTFNDKKADGRTLHVYWKNSGTGPRGVEEQAEPAAPAVEDTMEVDENAESREAENRLREERRGNNARGPAPREDFPAGPKDDRGYDQGYYRGPRRADPAWQDGRYGYGGGDRFGGPRGRYRDEGRMYSDRMGRGGFGQTWRP